MVSSIDGRLVVDRFSAPASGIDESTLRRHYDSISEKFHGDGWVVGRQTMDEVIEDFPRKERTVKLSGENLRDTYLADRKGRNLAVCFDPKGKCHYGQDNAYGDHLVVVLGEQVSDEYLAGRRFLSFRWPGRTRHQAGTGNSRNRFPREDAHPPARRRNQRRVSEGGHDRRNQLAGLSSHRWFVGSAEHLRILGQPRRTACGGAGASKHWRGNARGRDGVAPLSSRKKFLKESHRHGRLPFVRPEAVDFASRTIIVDHATDARPSDCLSRFRNRMKHGAGKWCVLAYRTFMFEFALANKCAQCALATWASVLVGRRGRSGASLPSAARQSGIITAWLIGGLYGHHFTLRADKGIFGRRCAIGRGASCDERNNDGRDNRPQSQSKQYTDIHQSIFQIHGGRHLVLGGDDKSLIELVVNSAVWPLPGRYRKDSRAGDSALRIASEKFRIFPDLLPSALVVLRMNAD